MIFPPDLDGSQLSSFTHVIRSRAQQHPGRPAFRFLLDGDSNEQTLTYNELDEAARAIAVSIAQVAAPGTRALLLYPPGLDLIAAFAGCLYAGVIAVPAYPPVHSRSRPADRRLTDIIGSAEATLLLTSAKIRSSLDRLMADDLEIARTLTRLKWILTDEGGLGAASAWAEPPLSRETIAFLQYTSGSTSSPRAVTISHGNLLHNSSLIYSMLDNSPETVGLSWLPPYHDMGLIGGIMQPLFGGFPVTLMSPYSFLQQPLRWLRAITRYKVTLSGGPNFAYEQCVRRITSEQADSLDLRTWRVALNGAEPVRYDTLRRFTEKFSTCGFRPNAFHPCYGLAEGTLMVSGKPVSKMPVFMGVDRDALEQALIRPGSAQASNMLVSSGTIPSEIRLAIVDPETMQRKEPGEIGEVWTASDSVGQGYWRRPEDTARTFRAHLADSEEGPFLRTGDLGFLSDGELFITGRSKDLIVVRGRNHYPQDIEATVERAHAAVFPAGIAVFAMEAGDEERVALMVEVDRRYLRDRAAEVQQAVRRAVCEEHGIDVYRVLLVSVGEIPRTTSGKIRRHACREIAHRDDSAGEDRIRKRNPDSATAVLPAASRSLKRTGPGLD